MFFDDDDDDDNADRIIRAASQRLQLGSGEACVLAQLLFLVPSYFLVLAVLRFPTPVIPVCIDTKGSKTTIWQQQQTFPPDNMTNQHCSSLLRTPSETSPLSLLSVCLPICLAVFLSLSRALSFSLVRSVSFHMPPNNKHSREAYPKETPRAGQCERCT